MDRGRPALRLIPGEKPLAEADPPRDATSLEAIFKRYSPYVAAVAIRLLGRDEDVDDVVQDVFLAAIKGIAQVREPEAIKGWLATVAVRVSRRKLQARRVRSFFGLDHVPDYEQIVAPGASPEQKALLGRVYAILDALPVEVRIAWVLRNIEGEQLDEVARLSGCSLATAKRRIAAAQQEMERVLSDA